MILLGSQMPLPPPPPPLTSRVYGEKSLYLTAIGRSSVDRSLFNSDILVNINPIKSYT